MDTNRDRKCLIAKLMEPIMSCLRSFGGSAKPKDVVAWIYKDISEFNNHREGNPDYENGYICDQVRWARQYLVWEGLIDNSKRGLWTISEVSRNNHLAELDGGELVQKWDKIHAKALIHNESEKISKCKEIALFRYGIISDFINQDKLEYGVKAELFKFKCNRSWKIPPCVKVVVAPV